MMYAHSFENKTKHKSYSQANTELQQELDEAAMAEKTKVTCICPKCGEHHAMSLVWIGRGAPRKYCQQCKDRI